MSTHRAPRARAIRRTAPVVATVVVVATIGAAAAAASIGTTTTTTDPSAPTATPTQTASPVPAEPQTTVSGWIEQTVGEPASLNPSTGEGQLLTVDVTSVEPGFECTADGAQPAKNGQYIALTVEIAAGSNFADELEMFPANPTDFAALGPDGGQPEDSQGNAASCIPAEDALPPVVTADQPATGTVVLDAPVETSSILYIPGGWEWPVPTKQ